MPVSPFSVPAQVKALLAATPVVNRRSPFMVDQPIALLSAAGSTVYGAKHPGSSSTTKYASFIQALASNKAFALPSGVNTPLATVSGAVTDANQLRSVVLVDGVISKGARGDQVAATGTFVAAAGGGTAAADATIIIKGTTAADLLKGSVLMSVASTGANTKTILVGDKLNIAGDTTDYFATATTATLNGTTEVEVAITPPLQQAVLANAVVTVTAASGKTILMGTAPAVGALVEVFVLDAADIITLSGGALTANRIYDLACYDFMHATALTNMVRPGH